MNNALVNSLSGIKPVGMLDPVELDFSVADSYLNQCV